MSRENIHEVGAASVTWDALRKQRDEYHGIRRSCFLVGGAEEESNCLGLPCLGATIPSTSFPP